MEHKYKVLENINISLNYTQTYEGGQSLMNIYVGYFNLAGKLHCFRECKSLTRSESFHR